MDIGHPALSVRRQCELLDLNRSSLYYTPAAESADNLRLMRLLDEEYTRHPFLGSRRLTKWLVQQGESVNRKRVQRLLRIMGLEAIYPKPRLIALILCRKPIGNIHLLCIRCKRCGGDRLIGAR